MKVIVGALIFLVGSFCGISRAADEKYTTKFDYINLDDVLNNERLYERYFKCLANKGSCTPEGRELKEVLPDALKTKCAKCNEKQKNGAEKVLKFIFEKKTKDFEELEKIYDPNGTYRKDYESIFKKGMKKF